MDEHSAEISTRLIYEVIGERQDDLPCYVCGEYGNTLIVRFGDSTRDMCSRCEWALGLKIKLGIKIKW
jgi:hypothetical protein